MLHDADVTVRPVQLRTDDDSGLVACGFAEPRLSWRLHSQRDGVLQVAYEIERAPDATFRTGVVTSSRVAGDVPFDARLPGPALGSREIVFCRVRLWTDKGLTVWSEPLRIEGALFEPNDWRGRPVSAAGNRGVIEPTPVMLLRRSFAVRGAVAKARVYVTALGIQQCWINGALISDNLLEPGWTAYQDRLLYASYDVTHLLHEGECVLAGAVADGWWRGNLTWMKRRAIYGDTTALLLQLEIDYVDGTSDCVATDENWRTGTGALRAADIYNGTEVDGTREPEGWRQPGFDDGSWAPALMLSLPSGLHQRTMPPVRIVQRIAVTPRIDSAGRLIADCGQNLTGYLRIRGSLAKPGTLLVRHAEVLDDDGSLQVAALRDAKATDVYELAAGTFDVEPSFTYHGFRFAELHVPEDCQIEAVEACVISSDLRNIGQFACSDERLNRLFSNIVWSQRGNFLALPTDCPQRDERLGWTGDIQVFAPTACTNFDAGAFLSSWLQDLALEQRDDGNVPSTVPNVIQGHDFEYGGIGWSDAATLVPWAIHEAYGCVRVLEAQFDSMRAWVDYGTSRLSAEGVWLGDFHLGDWLDPGAPADRPEQATTDRDFIASAYLAYSAAKTAAAARIVGQEELGAIYDRLSGRVAEATWRHWQQKALTTQTGCAIAIAFGIVPPDLMDEAGRRLAALVNSGEGRIATGFLGTPLVLPALTATGQHEAAFRLLLNEKAPGWLYQVANGATTMWERWDAILPDGSINRGEMADESAESMTSFNHYAYGAVGAWLYRSLAGIAPDERHPGYRMIRFAPQPGGGLTWARAQVDTPFGRSSISWRHEAETLSVEVVIPHGAEGEFVIPDGWSLPGTNPGLLRSGDHHLVLRSA